MNYSITVNVLPAGADFYIRPDATNPTSIEDGGNATLKFTADGQYFQFYKELDDAIEVTGASVDSWSCSAPFNEATLVIKEPGEDIVINLNGKVMIDPQVIFRPFKYNGKAPIDTRLVLTKDQMRRMNDNHLPDYYFALCKDDQKFYIYDKSLSVNEETGKYRRFENYITFDNEKAKENIEQAIINSERIQEIEYAEIEAAQKIENIEAWIDNVRLDGGEVKAYYDLVDELEHTEADEGNPSTIAYKGSASLRYYAESGYALPIYAYVNGVHVGEELTDCVICKAQWDKESGVLELEGAVNEIAISITSVEV